MAFSIDALISPIDLVTLSTSAPALFIDSSSKNDSKLFVPSASNCVNLLVKELTATPSFSTLVAPSSESDKYPKDFSDCFNTAFKYACCFW